LCILGSAPDPAGELTALPQTHWSGLKAMGLLLTEGKGGSCNGRKGREGKGKGRKGKVKGENEWSGR